MEMQNSFIPLYKRRSIGDKLGVTFELIKTAKKPLFKYMFYLLFPFFIVEAYCLNDLTINMPLIDSADINSGIPALSNMHQWSQMMSMFGLSYFLIIICAVSTLVIFTSLLYALIKCNSESSANEEFSSLKFRALLIQNIKKMVILILFCIALVILLVIIVSILAAASLHTLWVIIPLIFICSIPLSLFAPTYIFEDISIFKAFRKCFRIGFPTWGGTFVLALINSIIGGIVSLIIGLPYITVMAIRGLISSSNGDGEMSFLMVVVFFIFCLLSLFGSIFSRSFVLISMGYQYGHATIVTHSMRVEDNLEHIDED